MRAGQVIALAFKQKAGVTGEMALALEAKRPVSREAVQGWVDRLRLSADTLEALATTPRGDDDG